MKDYRVIAKIDKGDDKGIVEYTLLVKKANDKKDAEFKAKYYFIDIMEVAFYGVIDISEI